MIKLGMYHVLEKNSSNKQATLRMVGAMVGQGNEVQSMKKHIKLILLRNQEMSDFGTPIYYSAKSGQK